MKIGAQIRLLRKEKGISQDVLAQQLGITCQAVSKWENGSTMPDITMLPMIARYFGVSVDYLLDYDLHNADEEIRNLCKKAFAMRRERSAEAESILREGLRRYPNDEIILNHLVYVLDEQGKLDETVLLCKELINSTRDDEVKYDAYRILLDAYRQQKMQALLREELNAIPELYFTKLELKATLLDGDEACEAARDQKGQSLGLAIEMLLVIVRQLHALGNDAAARQQLEMAKQIYVLLRDDPIRPQNELFDLDQLKSEIEAAEKEQGRR